MRAALAIVLLLLGAVAPAGAADAPLLGKTLRLRDSLTPTKRSAAIALAGAIDLTGVDPTQAGATVTVASGTTSYSTTVVLAPAHWSTVKTKPGKPAAYRYKETDLVAHRSVAVKLIGGKLFKLKVRGAPLPSLGGPLGSVVVTVDAGALRLCALFGGKIKKDDGKKFFAAKAPAPASCPVGSTTTTTIPAPPVLGTQLDRDGRPGISALIVALYGGQLAQDRDAALDAYNAAASPTAWSGAFGAEFQTALALWDGVDAVCGNQLDAGSAGPGRYQLLASVLVDDQLFVDTTSGTCTSYLQVEQGATGTDCGGRVPTMDVVDTTYSLLMVGSPTGVGDGVTDDNLFSNTFPFLNLPNN